MSLMICILSPGQFHDGMPGFYGSTREWIETPKLHCSRILSVEMHLGYERFGRSVTLG